MMVNLQLSGGIKNKKGPSRREWPIRNYCMYYFEKWLDRGYPVLFTALEGVIKKIRCRPPSTDTLTDAHNLTHTLLACVIASYKKSSMVKSLKAITNLLSFTHRSLVIASFVFMAEFQCTVL